MGWSGGNEVFDAMAKQMQTAPRNMQLHVMRELIKSLEAQDWDDADSALEDWKHVPAYVEAFKACGYEIEEEERIVEVTLYAHEDPDEGWDELVTGITSKLPWPRGDERWRMQNILYEIEVNCEVNSKTGAVRIVGIDGHKLIEPLPWHG